MRHFDINALKKHDNGMHENYAFCNGPEVKEEKQFTMCMYWFFYLYFYFWEDILYTKYPIGS